MCCIDRLKWQSLAALHSDNTRTAASGYKAAIPWQVFQTLFLNVRFHQKRSFSLREIYENEGLLSARSGRGSLRIYVTAKPNNRIALRIARMLSDALVLR